MTTQTITGRNRNAYPRPDLARENWICLNGEWEFAFGDGKDYDRTIRVPFCPESELSGIGRKDFFGICRYRRTVSVPQRRDGERLLLHFEAAFYHTDVFVNGKPVCAHDGGYTPFTADITDAAAPETEAVLEVRCEGDARNLLQPSGKQSHRPESFSCFYTRSTGIWQTVWMEQVPETHLRNLYLTTDPESGTLRAELELAGSGRKDVSIRALFDGQPVGEAEGTAGGETAVFTIPLRTVVLWEPEYPILYDLEIRVGEDEVRSYFGMRSLSWDRDGWILNGKHIFLRFVLDQGYYPEGGYTAPGDEDLVNDIRLSMAAGFNGARLHEKVFERRFLYHCDRMGYLVHGEYPNWGFDYTNEANTDRFLKEWGEAVFRDRNHPCLIGWCPLNECWDIDGRPQSDAFVRAVYRRTKEWDPTRPVLDVSWTFHVETDVYDVHDYEQNSKVFLERYRAFPDDNRFDAQAAGQRIPYDRSLPFFVSEYGGFRRGSGNAGWGYGTPVDDEAYVEQFLSYAEVMLQNPDVCGFCFTQLYDVELEENGIYTYGRERKFPPEVYERFRKALSAPAALETRTNRT
ncbi:MAG: beta-galactosidase [Clostridia bacterium]|nr:beta-galactosidase [Clostridia bacterium]